MTTSPVQSDRAAPLAASVPADPRHPWRRWFARMWLDYVFIGFVLGMILGAVAPDSPLFASDYVLTWVAALLWIPIEVLLIAKVGTTPGKYLVGMTVRRSDGQLLSVAESFKRAGSAWAIGCGCLLPLVFFFTFGAQYSRLRKGRDSSWDEAGQFVVQHQPLSLGRSVLLIAAVGGILALVIMGTEASPAAP